MLSAINALIAASLLITPLPSASRAGSDVVLVREADVVDDDLYAVGNDVIIHGTVEGDLSGGALREVLITGKIEGDVQVVAARVEIEGEVIGSLRAIADRVVITGKVGGDVVVLARRLELTGEVAGDLLVWASEAALGGSVGGELEGRLLRKATLVGEFGSDIDLAVERLVLGEELRVAGDLRYRSGREASGTGDGVSGSLIHQQPPRTLLRVRSLQVAAAALGLILFLIISFGFLWLAPRTLSGAIEAIEDRPLTTLGVGVGTIVIAPGVFVLPLVVGFAATPDLVAGTALVMAPLLLAISVFLMFGLVVGAVPLMMASGRRLLRNRRSAFAAFAVGVLPWVVVGFIPFVGPLLLAVGLLAGLGSVVLGGVRGRGSVEWALPER